MIIGYVSDEHYLALADVSVEFMKDEKLLESVGNIGKYSSI